MGRIITSPGAIESPVNKSVFLAGGISGCSNWQEAAAEWIAKETDAIVYNPRRVDFDMSAYEEISRQQIRWEYYALRVSTVNLFWFPSETLCPITLFELGSALERMNPGALMVGADVDYKRLFDVEVQCQLKQHPHVFADLDQLVEQTIILLNSFPA
jgi:hypothetical protein